MFLKCIHLPFHFSLKLKFSNDNYTPRNPRLTFCIRSVFITFYNKHLIISKKKKKKSNKWNCANIQRWRPTRRMRNGDHTRLEVSMIQLMQIKQNEWKYFRSTIQTISCKKYTIFLNFQHSFRFNLVFYSKNRWES